MPKPSKRKQVSPLQLNHRTKKKPPPFPPPHNQPVSTSFLSKEDIQDEDAQDYWPDGNSNHTQSSTSAGSMLTNGSISSVATNSESNQEPPADAQTSKKIRIPPIFIHNSADWRRAAPIVYKNPDLPSELISAQATTNGSILIKTTEASHFRFIQKTLLDLKIEFKTSILPELRTLKLVLRGIPTEELKSELELLNFDIKLVKRFGPPNKPMPICLVILSNEPNSKEIFEITELFYIKVTVESYKKIGPSQCFACQRTGHGSSTCTYSLRCVKCSGEHNAKDCSKTLDQNPTCCNCGGNHTANYRGCPYLSQTTSTKPTQITTNESPIPPVKINPTSMNYASAAKSKQPQTESTSSISNQQILTLLCDLLSTINSSDDPKKILTATIKSFISLFTNQQ